MSTLLVRGRLARDATTSGMYFVRLHFWMSLRSAVCCASLMLVRSFLTSAEFFFTLESSLRKKASSGRDSLAARLAVRDARCAAMRACASRSSSAAAALCASSAAAACSAAACSAAAFCAASRAATSSGSSGGSSAAGAVCGDSSLSPLLGGRSERPFPRRGRFRRALMREFVHNCALQTPCGCAPPPLDSPRSTPVSGAPGAVSKLSAVMAPPLRQQDGSSTTKKLAELVTSQNSTSTLRTATSDTPSKSSIAPAVPSIATYYTPGLPNVRDVASADPEVLQPGRLFRSSTPALASDKDRAFLLQQCGIKTIIELRSEDESFHDGGDGWVSREFTEVTYADAAATPGRKLLRLPLAGRFTVFVGMLYHMPWLLRLQVLWCVLLAIFIPSYRARVKPLFLDFMNDLGLHGLNEIMLEFSARNIGRVMRVLSNPDNYPVLVNCSHGKDRTGLIIALVLLVCKVPPAKVVRDYALSDKFGQTIEARAKFSHVPELDVDAFCRAKPMTMKWTIEYIYRVHGSVQAYLQSIDVDTEIRERIRSCLRDANPEHDQEKDLLPGVF
eukprot:m.111193 g.111193  ORF g.111193 m.111193 type:complete len:559 (+) comp9365_c0_seq2:4309-5985(+)